MRGYSFEFTLLFFPFLMAMYLFNYDLYFTILNGKLMFPLQLLKVVHCGAHPTSTDPWYCKCAILPANLKCATAISF